MTTPARRKRAGLVGLLGAEAVSDMGSKMTFVALPWLVLITTGSPIAMGVVAAAELLPYILALALCPPLVDRLGSRTMSIVVDIASAVVVAVLVLTYRSGLGHMVILVAMLGALRGIAENARAVLLRPVGEAAGANMLRLTSVYHGISRFNDLAFVPLGGVLIALFGAPTAIAVDAASFVAAAAIVAAAVPRKHPDPPDARPPARQPYLAALRDGARYLRQDRLLVGIYAMFFITNLCHQANAVVLVPLWVRQALHTPAALGLLTGGYALGALIGSAVFTLVAPMLSRYLVFTLGFLVGGAPRFLALAFGQDLTAPLAAFFLSGLAVSPVIIIIAAVLYERVPAPMQARVFGTVTAVAMAGMPLGVLVGGLAASALGLRTAALLVGAVYVAATLAPVVWHRTWRQMDNRPAVPITT